MLHVEPLCVSLLDCVAVTVDFDFGVTLRLRSRCLMFFSCILLWDKKHVFLCFLFCVCFLSKKHTDSAQRTIG